MDFRRSAARRRRVMREDVLGIEQNPSAVDSATQFQRYNTEELLRNQPMVLDWFPKRRWTNRLSITMLLVVGLAAVAAHYRQVLSNLTAGQGALAEISDPAWNQLWSLNEAQSLTQLLWSSLGLGALVMVYQLFLLRRHREDDYGGTYQVWLWALPVAFLAAVMAIPSVRMLADLGFQSLSQTQQPQAWAITTLGISCLVAATGLRLMWEVNESRLSVFTLAAATGMGTLAGLLSAAIHLGWPLGPLAALPVDIPLALAFLGTILWNASLLAYLGYVCRDVDGLIPHHDSSTESAEQPVAASPSRPQPSLEAPSESDSTQDVSASDLAETPRRRRRRNRQQAA